MRTLLPLLQQQPPKPLPHRPAPPRPNPQEKPQSRIKVPYQAAARRITAIMVATPFAIVLSYLLWKRLVWGEERKVFRPGEVVRPLAAGRDGQESRQGSGEV